MAEYYCDHGAYASALGTTPTWGVPQEGDGSAITPASASAIASIKFNAVPTSGAYTLMGASVSVSGVLSAASAAAAATALAANINATTATVSSTAASGVPQLRNLVYARVNPGDSAEVQIMTRVGSTTLNHATNSNVAQVHTFNGAAPTVVQFIGGTGGCWGWLLNPAAIGVSSSIALLTYGCLIHAAMVGPAIAVGDKTFVRTGSGNTVTYTETTDTARSVLPAASNKHLVFDTNTKWTGDSGTGVFKLVINGAQVFGANFWLPWSRSGYATTIEAIMRGGFELEVTGYGGGGGATFKCTAGYVPGANSGNHARGRAYLRNVKFSDTGVAASLALFFGANSYEWGIARYLTCDYVATTPRTTVVSKFNITSYSGSANHAFEGCTFDYNISGAGPPGDLVTLQDFYFPRPYARLAFKNCAFLGFASGFTLMSSAGGYATIDEGVSVTAEGCTGLAMPGTYIGWPVSGYVGIDPDAHLFVLNSLTDPTNPGLRYENTRGVIEWLPSNSPLFPTLSSVLLGSGAAWSLRMVWLQALNHTPATPLKCVPLKTIYRLSTATRDFSVELFVPNGLATDLIRATFNFTDSGGTLRSVTATELAASSASWTNAAANSGHESKKLTVASGHSVLANTEISCSVEIVGVAPTGSAYVWVDPEFVVA